MRRLRDSLRRGRHRDNSAASATAPAPPASYSPGAVVADYYVDSVSGDDANDGLSSGAPLATIAELLTRDLSGGVTVGLACGSHWREKLVAEDSLTILGYGTGALPILDCSDIVTGWAKTAGRANVYEATISTETGQDFNASFHQVYEDDIALWRASDLADLDSTPGRCYVADDTATPVTIYIHATDSGDPTANGSTYEVAVRQYGINAFQKGDVTVNHVECRRNLANNGSGAFGQSATLQYCIFRNGGKHNLYVGRDATIADCWLYESYYDSNSTMLVVNEDNAGGAGVVVRDTYGVRSDYEFDGPTAFINSHNNVSGSFGALQMIDVVVWNLRDFLSNCGSFDTVSVLRPVARNVLQFCSYVTDAAHTITDMDWQQKTGSGTGDGFVILVDTSLSIVRGTARYSQPKNGIIYSTGSAALSLTGFTVDCSFTGASPRRLIYCTGTPSSLTVDGVTMRNVSQAYYLANAPTALSSDNNCLTVDASYHIDGTTHANLAAWQGATGEDGSTTIGTC